MPLPAPAPPTPQYVYWCDQIKIPGFEPNAFDHTNNTQTNNTYPQQQSTKQIIATGINNQILLLPQLSNNNNINKPTPPQIIPSNNDNNPLPPQIIP
eukprot:221592_1